MPLLYEKTIRVYMDSFDGMSDADMDKVIQRIDDLLEDEPLEDAVIQMRKEYPEPKYRVEVD